MAKYVEWTEFIIYFHTFVASTFQKGNKYLVKMKEHENKNALSKFFNPISECS